MKTKILSLFLAVFLSLLAGTAIDTRAQQAKLVVETGHSSLVASVAFSLDGKTMASSSWDLTIRLWDVASGAELVSSAKRTTENSPALQCWESESNNAESP